MSTELLSRMDCSRKDQRLRDQLDRLDPLSKMDTVYPTALSRHKSDCSPPQSYKRTVKKKVDRRGRFRTQPITFMEIKEVDEEMSEDLIKTDTSEDKTKSDLYLKKKSSQLARSHSCRKPESGSRKKLNVNKQNGSLEDVVSPGDEDELRDVVDDHLQNGNISMKSQRGFSTRTIPSI